MKIGLRTPNIEKKLKAKTTGALKRSVKSAVNPLYGKKGIGLINNPKKALYNKIYNKVTIDPLKIKLGGTESNETQDDFDYYISFEDALNYVKNEQFTSVINPKLAPDKVDFILRSAAKKIEKDELIEDEDIEDYIATSSRNMSINLKLFPILFKFVVIPALIILVLVILAAAFAGE